MTTIELPRLIAGRDVADRIMDQAGELSGQDLVVDARSLVSATASFSAQLVRRALADGAANRLIVAGAPDSFAQYLRDAAHRLGVEPRLDLRAELPLAGAAA